MTISKIKKNVKSFVVSTRKKAREIRNDARTNIRKPTLKSSKRIKKLQKFSASRGKRIRESIGRPLKIRRINTDIGL